MSSKSKYFLRSRKSDAVKSGHDSVPMKKTYKRQNNVSYSGAPCTKKRQPLTPVHVKNEPADEVFVIEDLEEVAYAAAALPTTLQNNISLQNIEIVDENVFVRSLFAPVNDSEDEEYGSASPNLLADYEDEDEDEEDAATKYGSASPNLLADYEDEYEDED
jgi:hypothetical protein